MGSRGADVLSWLILSVSLLCSLLLVATSVDSASACLLVFIVLVLLLPLCLNFVRYLSFGVLNVSVLASLACLLVLNCALAGKEKHDNDLAGFSSAQQPKKSFSAFVF